MELERDQLLRNQTEVILEVQQRSGLKELLLSRRLAILSQTLETREAQLCAALSASTTDPVAGSGAAHRVEVPWFCCFTAEWYHRLLEKKRTFRTLCLQEILAQKQAAIAALRRDVARECKVSGVGVSRVEIRVKSMEGPIRDCVA